MTRAQIGEGFGVMKGKLLVALAALSAAAPALADVKAGVEAWSRGDYAAAIAEWRAPAAAGDADAQFNLGQAYKLGRGVPVDPAMATEWFRKAAAKGHAQAQDNYALSLFQDGHKAEAVPWLEKSVARDEKRTELVLGTMLFNGDGVPRDWTRAYALVTRSSQQGLAQGSQTLSQMDRYIPEAQRRDGLALAQKIEAQARVATLAAPAPTLAAPGASYAAPGSRTTTPQPRLPEPKLAEPKLPEPKPAPARPPVAAKAPIVGKWRVQLGAFGDPANARRLWTQVGGRVGGTPDYIRAGALTKLQATGFASRADARKACARAAATCVVVAP